MLDEALVYILAKLCKPPTTSRLPLEWSLTLILTFYGPYQPHKTQGVQVQHACQIHSACNPVWCHTAFIRSRDANTNMHAEPTSTSPGTKWLLVSSIKQTQFYTDFKTSLQGGFTSQVCMTAWRSPRLPYMLQRKKNGDCSQHNPIRRCTLLW